MRDREDRERGELPGEEGSLPIHEANRAGRDEERVRRRDDRSSRPDTATASSADTLAAAVEQLATRPSTVERRGVTATLVGVPRIDLGEFVYEHQLDPEQTDQTRPVALFDLENTGESPIRWRDARTTFVGDDDYTYQPAHVSLDPAQLGPGCHTRQVEIDPGRRARVVTLVEELPAGVDIAEVVHTLSHHHGEDERFAFAVE